MTVCGSSTSVQVGWWHRCIIAMMTSLSLCHAWARTCRQKKKRGALFPQKPLTLIRDGEVGGSGSFISNTCSLHCHHQNDAAIRYVGSCVSHFNASLIVWAKSQDSVHKPQFLKRTESRSGSNQGPFACQPSALPLGHTGSRLQAEELGTDV